jgi:exopolysaccharide biosynthesis polyprenyl glycosylphosphotransferase
VTILTEYVTLLKTCMRNNTSIIYNFCLIVGDGISLVLGLSIAYILRVTISHRVLSVHVHSSTYLGFLLILLPFWLLIFGILGLYNERNYQNRFSELGRLVVGSLIGILFAISYSYIVNTPLFPARLVAVYGFIFSLLAVLIFRTLARGAQRNLFSYGVGLNNVLIVGDTRTTKILIDSLSSTKLTGYKIIGVVSGGKNPIKESGKLRTYIDFNEAIHKLNSGQLHTIIQTELYSATEKNDAILTYAQANHIAYKFVPGNSELFFGNIKVDLLYSTPVITVHQTALIGWGRVVKRLTDIILGSLLLIISSPFMLVIIICQWLSSPKGQIFYRVNRLSRYGDKVRIYKFRTMKQAYTNMSPEDGFTKMGRPELIKQYRDNGDQLENDPRINRLGRFLRRNSLDELPQLLNVVMGDISLVGPRALDPFELERYDKKNLILSVKSGLTGLAQISGRRDISFDERRKLDLYYVQNWSFWGDMIILAKTISVVIFHQGAK